MELKLFFYFTICGATTIIWNCNLFTFTSLIKGKHDKTVVVISGIIFRYSKSLILQGNFSGTMTTKIQLILLEFLLLLLLLLIWCIGKRGQSNYCLVSNKL